MSKLEEKECLQRARAACLQNVKTLNCWGCDLNDISIIEEMINLEVLNVSVNNITTLKNLAFCPRLKEIYMRKNQVASLEEIKYLKKLPQLKVLWLSDNPCSQHNNYRNTVLYNLPNLQKLDSVAVTSEELRVAKTDGKAFKDVEYLPDYTGLNLTNTLTNEMLQKFIKKDELLFDQDEKPEHLDLNAIKNMKQDQSSLKQQEFLLKSNTYNAVVLLLEELSQTQLESLQRHVETLIASKKTAQND